MRKNGGNMDTNNFTLRGKRILICEDEGLIQMQWKQLLDFHGASVIGFTPSGDECVDLALKDRPDIVLMDVGLTGIDGWEASRRILQQWDTCIVMVTAQPRNLAEETVKNIKISGYIEKPASGADFIQKLCKYYSEAQHGNSSEQ